MYLGTDSSRTLLFIESYLYVFLDFFFASCYAFRPMRHSNRKKHLLDQQNTKKKGPGLWLILLVSLLGINIYLFGIRGLPELTTPKSPDKKVPPHSFNHKKHLRPTNKKAFTSSMGEMLGVAGVRESPDPSEDISDPDQKSPLLIPHMWAYPNEKFNLQRAKGVAGQRSIEQWCHRIEGAIEPGDNMAHALVRSGIDSKQAFGIIQALKPVFNFRLCRIGERFEALQAPDGTIHRFSYHKNAEVSYLVRREGNSLIGERKKYDAKMDILPVGVSIHGSLWTSLDKLPKRADLVARIVDIFAWDIDFYMDTHPGDKMRFLIERYSVDGKFTRWGRILAAEYSGDIGVHRAFWYQSKTDDSTIGYFDEKGGSLRKAFLKSPLKFARISSRFGMRVHPTLGFTKMHNGVDLAAPRGTPIWAPADGTVTVAGRRGASGIMLKLRHANGYETVFCHLSKISKGVRVGARVHQKQVIARVGSTGRSTGPHLHYGMKLRGRYINPMNRKFPPAKPVPKSEMKAYKDLIAPVIEQLDEIRFSSEQDRTASVVSGIPKSG